VEEYGHLEEKLKLINVILFIIQAYLVAAVFK